MRLVQQHIINKVFLDIETRQTQTAYYLKDHLDVFLKNELFPHLERYFETIEEDLPAAIVQIPKVSIDLTVKKQSDLKEGYVQIKEKLVTQIANLLTANPSSDKVLHINTSESTWRGLHHFLSHGTTPWWKGSKSSFTYTPKDIVEITKSLVFPEQFRSLIQQKVIRRRLIYQCTDHDLKILLTAAFSSNNVDALINASFIDIIKSLRPEAKTFIWHNVIDYLQSQDERALISYCCQQLVQDKKNTTESSDYTPSVKAGYYFAKATLHIIQQLLQINPAVVPFILQKHKDQKAKEGNLATTLLVLSHSLDLIAESQFLKNIIEQKGNKMALKENNEKDNTALYAPTDERVSSKDTESENTVSAINPTTEKVRDEIHKNDTSQDQRLDIETLNDSTSKSQESKDKIQTPTPISEKTDHIELPVSTPGKRGHQDSELTDLTPNTTNSIEKNPIQSDKDITTSNNSKLKQQKPTTPQQADEDYPKQRAENNSPKGTADAIEEVQQQPHWKSFQDSSIQQVNDMHFEDIGTYHIQNAGLIIAHPFIKHFLENCELLDSNGNIIDKELAVHAIHYVVTQKEQQLESDMLFEKMLCGVPIQQPINRHIVLSPLIKEQSEELLKAILENWPVLSNASPDLLRHEFLQRPGLLSFKDDNPKITIERKTQDILLDQLPWNIGLCKLPWIEKLIFTDW